MKNLSRRDAANVMAWRQGIPQTQAGIDAMYAALAAKLNASQKPIEARRASSTTGGAKPIQSQVDWRSIVAKLNAEARLP